MKVIDPGHQYELAHLDGDGVEVLTFVKREGEGYPGNLGSHPGTNIQESIRVLIDRMRYLDRQVPHPRNSEVIGNLRSALIGLECRAAERHFRTFPCIHSGVEIEAMPVCPKCGHIGCEGVCRT